MSDTVQVLESGFLKRQWDKCFKRRPSARKSTPATQLFNSYILGVQACWTSIPIEAKNGAPQIVAVVDPLMKDVVDETAGLQSRWSAAYLSEQLIAQLLTLEAVIAEGDRRLFEAKALSMRSADSLISRWEAAKKLDKGDAATAGTLRAIYVTILDDLQWLYNKRSLDRQTRNEIVGPMVRRAYASLALCCAPFLLAVLFRRMGWEFFDKIDHSYWPTLAGGYLALFFGALGALFSRLISFEQQYRTIDYDDAATSFVGRSLDLRQIVGAVGALVFFFAICGDLLKGILFPDIGKIADPAAGNALLGDLAKLVVWTFLAGFSERLVPDFLTRAETTAASANRPNT